MTANLHIKSDKTPAKTRVVVAMSGGVDSSVTAALYKEAGYDVVGITLQLYDHGMAVGKKGACCAGQDIYDASQVAERMKFPHYVLDYESKFTNRVIDDFADSYLRGETPIPCVRCNQSVKFVDLLKTAHELGADALATGHYVRRVENSHGAELHRGLDPAKDQSYFLFSTTRDQLDFLRFPLGSMSKDETRAHAKRFGLPVYDKPDSQDICFVPNGKYADLVKKLRPGAIDPGDIMHVDGRKVGSHDGIINFTIGQRRGLNVGGIDGDQSEPLYVIAIEAETKRVIVGPREYLAKNIVFIKEVNWLGNDATIPADGQKILARLRSMHKPVAATIIAKPGNRAQIQLDVPEYGISPGQAAVFYDADNMDRCLGGGWITGTEQL